MTFVDQDANSSGSAGNERSSRNRADKVTHDQPAGDAGEHHVAGFLARNRRSVLLNRVVEAEILPRLALARSRAPDVNAAGPAAAVTPDLVTSDDDTAHVVHLLMGSEDVGALLFIETLELRGATPASLYLGIITQAARRLGELWEEDRCDFAQVTIGLGRLQQIVRALSPSFQTASVSRSAHADTVLLLPAPGEQHTIGLVILAEFFQREGWQVAGGPVSTGYDAADLVRGAWVDIAGFSIGSIKHVDGLTACINAVRRASRNRYVGIMVGGPLFLRRPDLVTRVGADTTAPDAPSAIRQARGLLAMRAAAD